MFIVYFDCVADLFDNGYSKIFTFVFDIIIERHAGKGKVKVLV